MIYFNVAGLSPFNQEVQREVTTTLEQFSRLLYSDEGIRYYRETLQRCRYELANWLGVQDENSVAFVPNATTASSLVLSRIAWKSEDQILTTTHENSTVLKEILALQSRGVVVRTLDPSSPQELKIQIERHLKSSQVRAIVMSHVSHIDGRIFPIAQLAKVARTHQAVCIIDGAQAVGHIPVSFQEWQPDAYFFPGHKWCGGPMGTGALILGKQFTNRKERTPPLWEDFELGTQNLGLIAGLAKACLIKQREGIQTTRLEEIREKIRQVLSTGFQFRIIEWDGPHGPGILSFTDKEKKPKGLLPPKVPELSWKTFALPNQNDQTGIRLSWSADTPQTDIEKLLTVFRNIN